MFLFGKLKKNGVIYVFLISQLQEKDPVKLNFIILHQGTSYFSHIDCVKSKIEEVFQERNYTFLISKIVLILSDINIASKKMNFIFTLTRNFLHKLKQSLRSIIVLILY